MTAFPWKSPIASMRSKVNPESRQIAEKLIKGMSNVQGVLLKSFS
jgi:hypothetical protein